MGRFAPLIGAIVGYLILRFPGALLGYFVGRMLGRGSPAKVVYQVLNGGLV
jgi:hypothetical protein